MTDVQLAPSSLRDLRQLGEAYKAGDKVLQKRLRDGLKAAGKPLAEVVLRQGSASLPRRGGLRARVLAGRPTVTASLGGSKPRVTIALTDKQKDSIAGLESGSIRHPVFNTGTWASQPSGVRGAYSRAFNRNAPTVRDRVNAEVAKGLEEIARDAS